MANLVSGKSGATFVQHVAEGKAGHHDRVGARFGQTAQRLFALGFVGISSSL
jgi:hypothetical protein